MLNLMSYAVKLVSMTSGTKAETKVEAPKAAKMAYAVLSPISKGARTVSEHATLEEAKMFAAAYGEGYWVMGL